MTAAAAAVAADVSNLASGFEGLMLQADPQLPTSPVQQQPQQQQQQAVLQGVSYLAVMPAAGGLASSSKSGSFGYHGSDAVGDSGACLATAGASVSNSTSLVGYNTAAGVVVSLPAMALSIAEQQGGVQDLQYYQQPQQQSRVGPQGW
jgi:hypothetical protein